MDNIKDFIDAKEYIEVNPAQVFLTIPSRYIDVYYKLLMLVADMGKDIVDDCNSICKNNNKTIISCWNLFQSALALHALNDIKQSEFFIHYIRTQLDKIYKGTDKNVYMNSIPIPIMEDGMLKGIINFNNNIKIYIVDDCSELPEGYEYVTYIDDSGVSQKVLTSDGKYVIYQL